MAKQQEPEGLDALLDEALEEFGAALPAKPSPASAAPSTPPVAQQSAGSSRLVATAADAAAPPQPPPRPGPSSRGALAFNPLGPRPPPRRSAAGVAGGPSSAAAAAAGPAAQQGGGFGDSGGSGGGEVGGEEEALRAAAAAAGLGDLGNIDDLSAGLSKLLAELAKVDDEALAQAAADLASAPGGGGLGPQQDGAQRDLASTLQALAEQAPDFGGGEGGEGTVEDPLGRLGAHPEMASLVDSIMQQLLSKDVLYQPMKDIGARYPDWLEANREKMSQDDYGRYCRQYEYIQQITALYESDPNDYTQLVNLLQQMQQCGQPPQEIVDELAPGMQFDAEGLPRFPGAAPGGDLPPELAECCIM